MGFCLNDFKWSCIASHLHFNYIFMHYRCVLYMLNSCVLVGLDWAEPMMFLMLHVTYSCIFHAYVPSFLYVLILNCLVLFFLSLSLSLSLFPLLAALRHLSENLHRLGTLFIPGHLFLILPLLMSGFVMTRPVWTSQELITTRHSFGMPSC